MKQPIWTQTYDVNTIVLDSRKRLGLFGLLNLLQDTAWLHAQHLGWGYDDLNRQGTIWVLVRQKLVAADWPVWGDKVLVRTWPRGATGALALREFEFFVGDRRIGECTTSWLILDSETRRPHKLNHTIFNEFSRAEGYLTIEAAKIALRTDLKQVAAFQVRNSDLDVNGHVNNTRYAQWITDAMTTEDLTTSKIDEYEVSFLSEARIGDEIVVERGEIAPGCSQFQGRRAGESKPVFAATLKFSAR
jgi:medium-chain acyl-[acyl-carrier-protein] hydrolase